MVTCVYSFRLFWCSCGAYIDQLIGPFCVVQFTKRSRRCVQFVVSTFFTMVSSLPTKMLTALVAGFLFSYTSWVNAQMMTGNTVMNGLGLVYEDLTVSPIRQFLAKFCLPWDLRLFSELLECPGPSNRILASPNTWPQIFRINSLLPLVGFD